MLNLLLKTLPQLSWFFPFFFILHLFILSPSCPLFSFILLFKRTSVMRFFDVLTFVIRSFVSVPFFLALIWRRAFVFCASFASPVQIPLPPGLRGLPKTLPASVYYSLWFHFISPVFQKFCNYIILCKKKVFFNGQYLGFRVSFMHGGKILLEKNPKKQNKKVNKSQREKSARKM